MVKKRIASLPVASLCLLFFICTAFLGGCGPAKQPAPETAVPQQPAAVQAEELQPGLNVLYFYNFYRYISEIPEGEEALKKGKPGPPIPQLYHRFGAGNVFDNGDNKGVGMLITGYVRLLKPGQYAFQAVSNDGIEMRINQQVVVRVSDPGVHKDKTSDPGYFTVAEGGWFPLQVKYFQRKSTAMVEMYWQPPGTKNFSVIPSEAYAHLP